MTPQDHEKTEYREKICRQVASLFALTTSGVAGEAEAAKNKVKALVKAHTLTFADVSPFGNEIALKVMRSFWSLPAETPVSAPFPSPDAGRRETPAETQARELREMLERLRRTTAVPPRTNTDRDAYGQPYTYPFWDPPGDEPNPWEAFDGSEAFRRAEAENRAWQEKRSQGAGVYVVWQGQRMRVQDLSEYALKSLIQTYDMSVQRQAQARRDAHDAIDAEQYDTAIGLLRSLGQKSAVSPEVYQALLGERQKRALRPGFWPF